MIEAGVLQIDDGRGDAFLSGEQRRAAGQRDGVGLAQISQCFVQVRRTVIGSWFLWHGEKFPEMKSQ